MSATTPGPAPLLPTKLFVPLPDPEVLVRARLIETLSAGLGKGLILVSAPAGSGKTTLIADWVRRSGIATGWLSLDPADDDPLTFLSYLVEAVEAIAAGAGERARSQLRTTPPPEPLLVAQMLLVDITSAGLDGVVVIDDYHAVSDPAIHEILTLLVERGPPSTTLVVITRSDPPLPLSRRRVRRQLCEIREADLRFRMDEAGDLVRGFCGHDLLPGSIEVLTGRTEGWAAGLQLAGIALRGVGDPDRFIADFQGTHAFVADYLTDEVLATISEDDRRFVTGISLLDRFCGGLSDAALATSGSQERLERLFRSNLFLVPLDAERRWFRFHHLFADLLRRRSDRADESDRHATLTRASAWCEANGAVDDAVRYALRAGDTQRAAVLVAQHGIQALAAGEAYKALRWTQRLPREMVESSLDLCVLAALSRSLIEPYDGIGRLAGIALDLLARGERPHPHVDDVALHARWVHAAAQMLDGGDPGPALATLAEVWEEAPADSFPVRASTQLVTGNLLRLQGRYADAEAASRRAMEIGVRGDSDLLRLAGVTYVAECQLLQGELQRAIATASAELERPQSLREVLGTQVANVAAILALALLETGDTQGAEHALRRARTAMGHPDDLTEHWLPASLLGTVRNSSFHSSAPVVFYGLAAHVRLMLRQGRPDAARRCLDALGDAGSYPADSMQRALLESLRVRLLTAADDGPALRRFPASHDSPSTGCRFWDDVRRLAGARAALGGGDAATACALVEPLLSDLRHRGSPLATAEAAVLHALACTSLLRRDDADRSTDAALELTATQQRLGPWLDAGLAAVPLLERAVGRARASDGGMSHTVSVLAALRQQNGGADADLLSDRELTVLRLLAAGHTNQQIGKALFLAVGTVKKHTHNIFAKLDVSNRTQAVLVAQERRLLVESPTPPEE